MRDLMTPVLVNTTPGNDLGTIDVHRLTATDIHGPAMAFRGIAEHAGARVALRDVTVRYAADAGRTEEQVAFGKEDFVKDGKRPVDLPAWGLYAEHLAKLDMRRVEIATAADDWRPARHVADVAELVEHEVAC